MAKAAARPAARPAISGVLRPLEGLSSSRPFSASSASPEFDAGSVSVGWLDVDEDEDEDEGMEVVVVVVGAFREALLDIKVVCLVVGTNDGTDWLDERPRTRVASIVECVGRTALD